jgi:flagellar basal-body rod protein FlgB
VIDSLTDSLKEKRVHLATSQDPASQASYRSTLDGGSPEAVPAPGLKTKNDGNNLAPGRDARLLAENAIRFCVASNLMRPTTSQVKEPFQEGNSL